MKFVNTFIILGLLLLSLNGCKGSLKDNKGIVLARVHNDYLYEKDLESLVPENSTVHDSIVFVRNYVNNWIKTKVMVEKAKFNLTDDQMDFESKLEEYKNSLIIYEYESKLLNQKLDSNISNQELHNYYNQHQADFQLKENILKAYYIIVSDSSEELEDIETAFKLPDSLAIDTLTNLSEHSVFKFFSDTSVWMSFEQLQQIIPIETYNQELFLKNKRFVKISGNNQIYMLKFVNFKISDETSPFELVSKNINNIILAKRKIILSKKIREEIFEEAAANNSFEIYFNK